MALAMLDRPARHATPRKEGKQDDAVTWHLIQVLAKLEAEAGR